MKRVLVIVAIFSCMFASASAYDFKLRIVDELDSIPVEGARVEVLQQDTVSKGVAYTDGFGIAQLLGLDGGEYKMKVSAEGFNPISAILNLTKDVEIGTLTIGYSGLEKATNLKEVVIEGARVTSDADKMTIVPRPQVLKGSLNTLDVLSRLHLPGVKVDAIGIQSLSIFGQAPVIKVDGVPQKLEYLNSIDPEQIAKIEYTDNPTARYLQDGVGGIINVVLKKQTQGGSVWAYVDCMPRTFTLHGQINATYNYKDSQFSLLYSDGWMNFKNRAENRTLDYLLYNEDYSFTQHRYQKWENPSSSDSKEFQASYQYQNKTGFMLNTTFSGGYNKSLDKRRGELSVNGGDPFGTYKKTKYSGFVPTLDIFILKEFADGKSIEANVVGSIANSNTISNLIEDNPEEYYELNDEIDNNTKALTGEVRWTQPIKAVKLSVGVKESYQYSHNIYKNIGEDRMHQSRTYFNTSVSGAPGNFRYSVGGGVSYNLSKSDSFTDHTWLPSVAVNLSYIPVSGLRLMLNSQYDPRFPALGQRSTIVRPDNPVESVTGNPDLKPQHTINTRLSGMYNYGKWDFSIYARDSYVGNLFSFRYFYNGDGTFTSHSVNLKNMNTLSAEGEVFYRGLFNHVDIGTNIGVAHYNVSAEEFSRKLTQMTMSVFVNANWGKWSAGGRWCLPEKRLNGYRQTYTMMNNYVYVAFSPGNWSFKLVMMSIGYEKQGVFTKTEMNSPGLTYKSVSNTPYWGNSISINVSYSLQYGRSYQQKQKGLYNYIIDESVLRL